MCFSFHLFYATHFIHAISFNNISFVILKTFLYIIFIYILELFYIKIQLVLIKYLINKLIYNPNYFLKSFLNFHKMFQILLSQT